jgi:hypothetical protein
MLSMQQQASASEVYLDALPRASDLKGWVSPPLSISPISQIPVVLLTVDAIVLP